MAAGVGVLACRVRGAEQQQKCDLGVLLALFLCAAVGLRRENCGEGVEDVRTYGLTPRSHSLTLRSPPSPPNTKLKKADPICLVSPPTHLPAVPDTTAYHTLAARFFSQRNHARYCCAKREQPVTSSQKQCCGNCSSPAEP